MSFEQARDDIVATDFAAPLPVSVSLPESSDVTPMREFLIRLFDALNGQEHRPSSPTASLERSIAAMTSDINASDRASQCFAAEVALARREVDAQRRRLSELDRGRRLARISDALTATMHAPETGLDSFSEAEAALAKVVANNHDARVVRQEMAPPAEQFIERLSDAGFGEPVQVRASDVLARLRAVAGPEVSQLIESHSDP